MQPASMVTSKNSALRRASTAPSSWMEPAPMTAAPCTLRGKEHQEAEGVGVQHAGGKNHLGAKAQP
jgi:hypothetical protein